MTTGRPRFFLVERYTPSISSESVASAAERLGRRGDASARHLYTVFVRDEETCLSIFEAADAGAVETANAAADFGLDRIVEVELFPGPDRGERARADDPADDRHRTTPREG